MGGTSLIRGIFSGDGQAWAEAFGERSLELRADLEDGDVRIAVQSSCGVAVRSWSPEADRFASATISSTQDTRREAEGLLRGTGEVALARTAGLLARIPSAEELSDCDPAAIVRAVHEVLRGFAEGVREGGADRGRAVVRLRLRRYSVASTDGADFTGRGLHIHVFAEAFKSGAMGASGRACAGLAELTGAAGRGLGRGVAEQAIRLSQAQPPPSATCAAIFAPVAAGVLVHEVVGHSLEADGARSGSALWRLRDQRFGPENLSVYDDARSAGAWEAVSADEEGTPLERAQLVTAGSVVGLATDRAAARRLGLPRSSGHGRRGGFAYRPSARVRHTVVIDGHDPPEAIVADTHSGVLIETIDSGEADVRNGRFTIRVREAREISGGRLGKTLTGFTVTGTIADFGRLDVLGNDGAQSHALCGRGSHWLPVSGVTPTLRLPRVDLHGAR